MSRPRTISDDALLEGAARAIARRGMLRLTLADVAAELGISPGTVVHRFGSKRGLLLGLMRRSIGRVAERMASRRATQRSPRGLLLGLGDQIARHARTPEALANHLVFLYANLSDPEFHRLADTHARAVQKEVRSLIRAAIAVGELPRCHTDARARAVQAALNGSLLQWAIEREGDLAALIRANIATVLGPRLRRRRPG